MPFHHYILKLSIAALFAAAATARAETLEHITAEALLHNPELQVLEQSIAAARGRVTSARTFANPELTIAPGLRRSRDGNERTSEFHGELSLSQLFEFPGKRALETAIAQGNVELAELAREAFRFQIRARVRHAVFDFVAARKIGEVRSEQAESAETFAESASRRVAAGYGSDFESLKGEAERIAAQKSLLQARGRMTTARITLNTLMGRAPDAPLTLAGDLEKGRTRGSRTDFVALALARNPALRTQLRQAELAGLQLRSTRFGRRPDVAIGPQIEYTKDEQTFGISATVALPFWDRKKGEIATATAEERKAIAAIEKTRAEILAQVTQAVADLESAQSQLALYTPAFLQNLKKLTAQAEKGYAQNTTTLLIYLDAKRTSFDTLADYYEALAHVAKARAELESAVGVPLELNP